MEYAVQAFNVSKNLVHAETNTRVSKNCIFSFFTRFLYAIFELDFMYAWIFALINYNTKFTS